MRRPAFCTHQLQAVLPNASTYRQTRINARCRVGTAPQQACGILGGLDYMRGPGSDVLRGHAARMGIAVCHCEGNSIGQCWSYLVLFQVLLCAIAPLKANNGNPPQPHGNSENTVKPQHVAVVSLLLKLDGISRKNMCHHAVTESQQNETTREAGDDGSRTHNDGASGQSKCMDTTSQRCCANHPQ
jgi:hypothetical protein